MKKIAFFMTTVLEFAGGFENSFMDTAKLLSSDPNYEVKIVTMDENFSNKFENILKFYYRRKKLSILRENTDVINARIGNAEYIKCKNFNQLKELIKESDVVYSKNEIIEGLILKFVVGKKNIKRLVYACGTAMVVEYPKNITNSIHNFIYTSFIYKFTSNIVDMFNVKNPEEMEIYSKLFSKDKVTLVPNGFDFESLRKKGDEQFDLKGDSKAFKIVWAGRLTEQKGVKELMKLYESCFEDQNFNDTSWHIAGEGEYKADIESFSKKYTNFFYYGHVENNKIVSMYQKADLFLSTSHFETFGNTLIEAIAVNTPVVARNIPGPSNIIIDGENGYFANTLEEYKQAITKIVKNLKGKSNIVNTIKEKFSNEARLKILEATLFNEKV